MRKHEKYLILPKESISPTTITSGSAKTGDAIDRIDNMHLGVVYNALISATLSSGETATVSYKLQESPSTTAASMSDISGATSSITLTGSTGGSTETTMLTIREDVEGEDQYARDSLTVTLSTPSGDSAIVGSNVILTGGAVQPEA